MKKRYVVFIAIFLLIIGNASFGRGGELYNKDT